MNVVATHLNDWSNAWSAVMIAMLWQSTLLAALVGLVSWALRKSSPAVRYWLWQILAIKMLIVPLWTVSRPIPWLPQWKAAELTPISANQRTIDRRPPPGQPEPPRAASVEPTATATTVELAAVPQKSINGSSTV